MLDADGERDTTTEIIWLDDLPVGIIRGEFVYYIESDHLGTPRQVIFPDNDEAVWRWDLINNPFGESAPDTDPDGDSTDFVFNLRFPGQQYDAESGLHYNYFRDYEPGTGRYLQSDPIGLSGGLATFGYAQSQPLNYLDTHGLVACESDCAFECVMVICTGVPAYPGVICVEISRNCRGDTRRRPLPILVWPYRDWAFIKAYRPCDVFWDLVSDVYPTERVF
jgi:RHS repeat-associated protein